MEIIIQATLVTAIFGTVIGGYVFTVNQINHLRDKLMAKYENTDKCIDKLKLVVTNHCSTSELRLERIETDVVEIKKMVSKGYIE